MSRKILVSTALGLLGASALAGCGGDAAPRQDARVYSSESGQRLSAPSAEAPALVAGKFLRAHGADRAADALRLAAEYRGPLGGLRHVSLEQQVAGLRVVGAYARAAVNDRGELVHVIDHLAYVAPGAALAPAALDERQALAAALRHLDLGVTEAPAEIGRDGNAASFEPGDFFHAAPRVERVALVGADGLPRTAFLVETWTVRRNLLHHTLVGGDGAVLSVESRTNTDRYNVFVEDPGKGPQTVVSGPATGGVASPAGWLGAGTQTTLNITGNNAHAYLDVDGNNRPDRGGASVTGGDFLTAVDLAAQPATAGNRNVAVQNLFYLNNVVHDVLYAHGFNEASGNFQASNFGRGGAAGDAVNAEAQDGSGTDNANFSTPADGSAPRMQMYLWTGAGPDHEVAIATPTAALYGAKGAEFGPALSTTGVSGRIVAALDGTAPASDGCEAFTNAAAVKGKIALVDRGTCAFTVKVANAQAAGATAVIVANNAGTTEIFQMGGTDRKIRIPAVMIGRDDGAALRAQASPSGAVRRKAVQPLMLDASLDADIVFHEYGHGLTWRMIGGMSGPMSGAIGEGMSDVLAILLNGDDLMGEYSSSSPKGIRRDPYGSYPRTYKDVTGAEVHDDGEIYGAIGWRLRELFLQSGLTVDLLLDYLVDGMRFTPATPTFEQMRDGILQAVSNAGRGHECLIWKAFAAYGVGVGARGVVSGSAVAITESVALPAQCQ